MAARGSGTAGGANNDTAGGATGRRAILKRWSDPLPLQQAVRKAPVLVELKDGYRGDSEALSFSLGDVLALEGDVTVKGRRVVMVHYTSEMEEEDGGDAHEEDEGGQGVYRSLLTIPWECLPPLLVRVCLDPEGLAYSKFLNTHFSQCNWRGQQQQLLGSLDEDHYDTVQELPPILAHSAQTSSSASHSRRPPPPPPKPHVSPRLQDPPSRDHCSRPPLLPPPKRSPDEARKGLRLTATRVDQQADDKPPPRPPRLARSPGRSALSEGKGGGVSTRVDQQADDKLQPRPPRLARSPGRSALSEEKGGGVCKPEVIFPSELPEGRKEPNQTQQVSVDDDYLELQEDEDVETYIDLTELRRAESEYKAKREQEKPEKKSIFGARKQEKKEERGTYNADREEQKRPEKMYSTHTGDQVDRPKPGVGQASKTVFVKPTVRVQPLTSKPTSPTSRPKMLSPVTSAPAENSDDDEEDYYDIPRDLGRPLQKLTCKQLNARLQLCGMHKLAAACETNCLDGAFFCSLSDQDLKKPPFSLTDFEVNIKLQKVKNGWVPK